MEDGFEILRLFRRTLRRDAHHQVVRASGVVGQSFGRIVHPLKVDCSPRLASGGFGGDDHSAQPVHRAILRHLLDNA